MTTPLANFFYGFILLPSLTITLVMIFGLTFFENINPLEEFMLFNEFMAYPTLVIWIFYLWTLLLLENPTIGEFFKSFFQYFNNQLKKYVLLNNFISLVLFSTLAYGYYIFASTDANNVSELIYNFISSPFILISILFFIWTYLLLINYESAILFYNNVAEDNSDYFLKGIFFSFFLFLCLYWFNNYVYMDNFSDLNTMFHLFVSFILFSPLVICIILYSNKFHINTLYSIISNFLKIYCWSFFMLIWIYSYYFYDYPSIEYSYLLDPSSTNLNILDLNLRFYFPQLENLIVDSTIADKTVFIDSLYNEFYDSYIQNNLFNHVNFDVLSNNSTSILYLFRVDILGLLFVALNILLMTLCLISLLPMFFFEPQIRLYIVLLLLVMVLLNMVFLAADLFTFFVAFEAVLIPMILLISIWGSPNRRQANNYLIFYTAVGAVPMLLGLLYLWSAGDFDSYIMLPLSFLNLHLIDFTWSEQMWLWVAFFISFAIKTPMVPFHIWLPKAHVDAPTTGSVILAGLLLKVGLFGFLRVLMPIFPLATIFFSPYIAAFATIGVLYASLVTLRQIDMKRIIAYSSVAHMNMALVSLCSLNSLGISSAIFLMLSHGLVSSALFFLVGFLYNRFHQRTVTYYGDIATIMPRFTIFFFLFLLANMAFPLTAGFIGEFCCLLAIMKSNYLLGILAASSMLLTTVYCMLLFGRVCLGNPQNWLSKLMVTNLLNYNNVKNVSSFELVFEEFIILIYLLTLTIFFGIYPQPIFLLINLFFTVSNPFFSLYTYFYI